MSGEPSTHTTNLEERFAVVHVGKGDEAKTAAGHDDRVRELAPAGAQAAASVTHHWGGGEGGRERERAREWDREGERERERERETDKEIERERDRQRETQRQRERQRQRQRHAKGEREGEKEGEGGGQERGQARGKRVLRCRTIGRSSQRASAATSAGPGRR